MAITQVQLIGGPFIDSELNVLANGTLLMELSQDEQITVAPLGQACGGIKIHIKLDASGNVVTSPEQFVLPTDKMNPSGAFYTVWGYAADGQLAWGPNYNLLVPTGSGTFNVDNWVPNSTGANGGTGNSGGILLQTNGVNNGDQNLLDLVAGTNVTITDDGVGNVVIAASGGSAGNGPRTRNWRGWTSDGGDGLTPNSGQGCTPATGSSSLTGISPTATKPMMLAIGSTTGSNTLESFLADSDSHTADASISLGTLGLYETQMSLQQLTTCRLWLGLGNGIKSGANFWKSNTPPEPTIGFRYSTSVPDTNFQCVVTDGTTQLTVDSGIVADTAPHIFGIEFSAPHVLFFIDGTQVASVAISTTTLSTASLFQGFFTIDNVGTTNDVKAAIVYNYWDSNV